MRFSNEKKLFAFYNINTRTEETQENTRTTQTQHKHKKKRMQKSAIYYSMQVSHFIILNID